MSLAGFLEESRAGGDCAITLNALKSLNPADRERTLLRQLILPNLRPPNRRLHLRSLRLGSKPSSRLTAHWRTVPENITAVSSGQKAKPLLVLLCVGELVKTRATRPLRSVLDVAQAWRIVLPLSKAQQSSHVLRAWGSQHSRQSSPSSTTSSMIAFSNRYLLNHHRRLSSCEFDGLGRERKDPVGVHRKQWGTTHLSCARHYIMMLTIYPYSQCRVRP